MNTLTAHTPRKISAKEARQLLLSGSAPILRDVLRLATGELFDENDPSKGYTDVDQKARATVLNAIIPMMQQAGDVQTLNAKSAQDIIGLLAAGKCSIQEALELMRLVQMQFEMTELKELSDKLDSLPSASDNPLSNVG